MRMLSVLILISVLTGCSYADIAKFLLPKANSGISVDAQIGDRENAIESNDTTIDAKDSTVTVENRDAKVESARDVNVNEVDPLIALMVFVMGSLFGVAVGLLLPQYHLIFKRKE